MRKTLTLLAVIVLVVAIVAGVGQWLRQSQVGEPGMPGTPPTAQQPEWCPAVEVIAAPGTWESRADDDPINPTANPNSLILKSSAPLQAAYSPDDVKVWTVPYTAQFRNFNAQHEMSYDDSQAEGRARIQEEMAATHRDCPLTGFVLMGFSQGAVIMGDMASQIGNGNGPVPADNVLGVALLADGRREPGKGMVPGNPVAGVGAEVALAPVNLLVQPIVPGATMRGGRPDGFGALNDRVQDICAPGDTVCDAPPGIGDAVARAQDFVAANGVHATYADNPNIIPGTRRRVDRAVGPRPHRRGAGQRRLVRVCGLRTPQRAAWPLYGPRRSVAKQSFLA